MASPIIEAAIDRYLAKQRHAQRHRRSSVRIENSVIINAGTGIRMSGAAQADVDGLVMEGVARPFVLDGEVRLNALRVKARR